MAIKLVTPPAVEPVTVDEAKQHLRVDATDDDALITSLIAAARRHAEDVLTWRAFVEQTWRLTLDAFPCGSEPIYLPRPPLIRVTSVSYLDSNGAQQTLVEGTDYIVDAESEPARIALPYARMWPVTLLQVNAVTVEYQAGYGTAATDVPESIRQALLLIIGAWYEHREAVVVGQTATEVPMAARALLSPYRAWPLCEQ